VIVPELVRCRGNLACSHDVENKKLSGGLLLPGALRTAPYPAKGKDLV